MDFDEKTLTQFAADNTKGDRDLKKEWLHSDKWDYEPVLAGLVCLAFGYAEYWVFSNAIGETTKMDPGMSVLIGRVLGTVDAAFMLLLSFRWGTSKGSERKTELMGIAQASSK